MEGNFKRYSRSSIIWNESSPQMKVEMILGLCPLASWWLVVPLTEARKGTEDWWMVWGGEDNEFHLEDTQFEVVDQWYTCQKAIQCVDLKLRKLEEI